MELSEDELKPGLVLGRYELLAPVAKGGMAQVWVARLSGTRGFQKTVAIKTMLPDLSEDPQFETMFLDEAALASRVRHPNAVEILDLGEEAGILYLVMEWIDGEPLSIVMKHAIQKGGIPLKIAVRVVMQACAGLHAAHELKDDEGKPVGLVHRDVSPQNILVGYTGVVKVVDFGVAKATGRVAAETNAGQVKGKVPYMSPEQATGGDIDRRTDLFAMGILLYMMTTGKHPFRKENSIQTVMAICSNEPIKRPSSVVPGYPRELERIVLKALSKRREDRFQTGNEFQRALDALPGELRASTDDEVGEFMKTLLSERMMKRQALLQKALREATKRGEEVRLSPNELTEITDEVSLGQLTPMSGVSQLSVYGALSRASNTGLGVAVVPEQPSAAPSSGASPNAWWRSKSVIASIVLLAAVSGIGAYVATSRPPTTVVAASAPSQPVAAPPAPSSAADPVATAAPEPASSAAEVINEPVKLGDLDVDRPSPTPTQSHPSSHKSASATAATATHAKPAATQPSEEPKPAQQPSKPAGTKPFVSPVRTVDF